MKWNYAPPESESGRNMSAMIALLMEWKYILPDNLKQQEQISLDSAVDEMEYALPDNWEWREQVIFYSAANEIKLRTAWELKVEGHISYSWNGKYAPAESQKWQENISHDDAAQWEYAPAES